MGHPAEAPKEPRRLRAAANETSVAFDALDRQILDRKILERTSVLGGVGVGVGLGLP